MSLSSSIKRTRALPVGAVASNQYGRAPLALLATAILMLAGTVLSVATAAAEAPPLAVEHLTAHSLNENGTDDTVAGGHPFEAVTSFTLPNDNGSVEDVNKVFTELPPGFVGNVAATPRCTLNELGTFPEPTCPLGSAIGSVIVERNGGFAPPYTVFNMIPDRGYPAEFGFFYGGGGGNAVILYPRLRPRTGGYGVTVVSPGTPKISLSGVELSIYGVPSQRNGLGGPPIPFLTNPVDCQEADPKTTVVLDSWKHPGRTLNTDESPDFGAPDLSDPFWKSGTAISPAVTGCESPALTSQFKPTIEAQPTPGNGPTRADSPAGFTFDLDFPQTNDATDSASTFDPSIPAPPSLKDITVTLPAGLSISPSAADGLEGCSDLPGAGDQVHYETTIPVTCPDGSKIGSVIATTPLLAQRDPQTDEVIGPEPVGGDVYVLKPHPGDLTQGQDGTFRVLIQVESAKNGVNVKIPGVVKADKATGQLVATFTENPQLPVRHLEVTFFSGPRASLATPVTCGTFTTTTDMVPWSSPGTPDATPSASFGVTEGAGGAGCPATAQARPFGPAMTAFTETANAGTASPFVLKLTRNDGEQELGAVNVTMPPGFSAVLAGIPYCSEAAIATAPGRTGAEEQASPSCPETSQIGSLTTGAGPGSNPYYVNGKAYLAGPYKGAPLSIVFITPAVAGPFDLGNVVVRAAVFVNPLTAQASVKSDPIPQIIDGVPLRLRSIVARIDRPGFTLNPTSCNAMSVNGEAVSSSGQAAALSNRFQVGGCSGLKFQPKFSVSLTGQASKLNGVALTTKLAYPGAAAGAVNLSRVKVQLPRQLPSRLSTLQQACTAAQFAKDPAGCPAGSVVGHAKVLTPLLSVPLTGSAYFVSHGGAAFPDLTLVLKGDEITVDLVGTTFITESGITTTTFKSTPDVPFTSFELTLPAQRYSAVGANLPHNGYSFCGQKLAMPTEFVAQNGALIKKNTPIAITGCKAKKKARKAKKAHKGSRSAQAHGIANRRSA